MCVLVVVNSYTGVIKVPNLDGKCEIDGNLVESGETYYDEKNCEALVCGAASGPISYTVLEDGTINAIYEKEALVSVLGCGVESVVLENGKQCRVESTTGKYPECCSGPLSCP